MSCVIVQVGATIMSTNAGALQGILQCGTLLTTLDNSSNVGLSRLLDFDGELAFASIGMESLSFRSQCCRRFELLRPVFDFTHGSIDVPFTS